MNIDLDPYERKMILDALLDKPYKAKVQNPATRHFIRVIYKKLVKRLIADEKLSQEIRENK